MKRILLWVALAGLVVGSASASTLDISESEVPGGAAFSFSFTPSAGAGGVVFVNCPGNVLETCTFDLTPPAGLTSANSFETVIIQFTLTEPGTNQVSDQLQFLGFGLSDTSAPVMHFSFASDTDVPGGGLGTCTFGCLAETGALQAVATATFGTLQGTLLDTVTIRIQSDIERVPEPATLGLLSLGLAGLGFSRRRKSN